MEDNYRVISKKKPLYLTAESYGGDKSRFLTVNVERFIGKILKKTFILL